MYREWSSRVPGAVVWQRTVPPGERVTRVLPDGCMDLMWADGALVVAGPDSVAQLSVAAPGTRFTALRFAPGAGPTVLGVPAHALRDQRVHLEDLWPAAQVRRLAEEVREAADPAGALERVAAARLARAVPRDATVGEIVARLGSGATVAATAEAVNLSARQLHRRCLDAFGYGPKTLVRILRMNRALDLARVGTPFAAAAASAGYADQAHLAREVKALAGVPLGTLLR